MVDDLRTHWEQVYQTRSATELSWYQPTPQRSLALIRATGVSLDAPLLDVGGGTSTLVDHLLGDGYTDVTVLDIASSALAAAKARLGEASHRVSWIEADITRFTPTRRYALWHDRAVFHFLVEAEGRQRYLDVLHQTLVRGGHLILATFGPMGPERCSGLPVHRYSLSELETLLSPHFRLVRGELEEHFTPQGKPQQFLYAWWNAEAPS